MKEKFSPPHYEAGRRARRVAGRAVMTAVHERLRSNGRGRIRASVTGELVVKGTPAF